MTREVTDNLYIELGYFTPEEYYTYEANADADFVSAVTFTCVTDAGSIQNGAAALSATVSVSVTASRIKEFAAGFTGVFSPTMSAVAIVNLGSSVNVVATMSVSVERNRAVDIALDNIANISAQAAKTVTTSSALQATFTQATIGDRATRTAVQFELGPSGQLTTTRSRFGTGSLSNNNSGTFPNTALRTPSASAFPRSISGFNWTMDFWRYQTVQGSTSSYVTMFTLAPSGLNLRLQHIRDSGTDDYYFRIREGVSASTDSAITYALPRNQHNHFRVSLEVQSSQTVHITLWLNGVRVVQHSTFNHGTSSTTPISFNVHSISSNEIYFYDEIRLYEGILTPKANTTLTVPTSAFVNDNNTQFLLHLDNSLLDDNIALFRLASANLTSVFTQSALGLRQRTGDAALTSVFTQSATAQKAILASASLASSFAQTALGGKLIDFNADLPVIASQLTAVVKVGQAVIACDVVASLSASAQVSRGLDAAQSSAFTQTATAFNIKQFASALSTTVTVTAVADSGKIAEADLDITASVTANAVRTRDVESNLSAVAALSAQVTATLQTQSALSATAALACDASRTRPFEAALPVIASQLSAVGKVGNVLADFAVTATVSASVIAGKIVIANLNSTVSVSANANRTRNVDSAVSSVSALTATGIVVKEVNSNISTAFTQTVTGTATKRADSVQSSAFTLFTTLSGLQQAQAALSAQASQSASAVATRRAQALLPVIASQLVVGGESSSLTAALSSTFTLQCQAIEIKIDPDLTYMIPKETRTYMIIEELRVHVITPELRTYTIATS